MTRWLNKLHDRVRLETLSEINTIIITKRAGRYSAFSTVKDESEDSEKEEKGM
jgi:hypothetical protein